MKNNVSLRDQMKGQLVELHLTANLANVVLSFHILKRKTPKKRYLNKKKIVFFITRDQFLRVFIDK